MTGIVVGLSLVLTATGSLAQPVLADRYDEQITQLRQQGVRQRISTTPACGGGSRQQEPDNESRGARQ